MATKEQYENLRIKVFAAQFSVGVLETDAEDIDTDHTLDPAIEVIQNKLDTILDWTNAKILEAEQEQVMNSFLAEMKFIFDKYTAKIEIGSDETGYGESYGTGETAVGIKFTATLDGVTSTKEINKSVINGGDLS